MRIQHASSAPSHSPVQANDREPKGYRLLSENRTVSKSALSKLKNFFYTAGTPFRAIVRQLVQSKVGDGAGSRGLINIKSAPTPAPASKEIISQSGVAYEVVDINEGFRRQSLFGKFFG